MLTLYNELVACRAVVLMADEGCSLEVAVNKAMAELDMDLFDSLDPDRREWVRENGTLAGYGEES